MSCKVDLIWIILSSYIKKYFSWKWHINCTVAISLSKMCFSSIKSQKPASFLVFFIIWDFFPSIQKCFFVWTLVWCLYVFCWIHPTPACQHLLPPLLKFSPAFGSAPQWYPTKSSWMAGLAENKFHYGSLQQNTQTLPFQKCRTWIAMHYKWVLIQPYSHSPLCLFGLGLQPGAHLWIIPLFEL